MTGDRKYRNHKKIHSKILNTTKTNTNLQQMNEIQLYALKWSDQNKWGQWK